MDGVIEAYKEVIRIIFLRPYGVLLLLLGFMAFQYVMIVLLHWLGCRVDMPEALVTAFWASCRIWAIMATFTAIAGIGG